MNKTEEELEITKFNYKCLKDEYKKLNEKYKELDGHYDELNDKYIKKLNQYNAYMVEMMDTKEAHKELTKENHKLIVGSCILALLWLVSSITILVG